MGSSGNHVVVDLSSDDDDDDFVGTGGVGDYLNWLNDLSSDSTDVVEVVSEVKSGVVDSQFRKANSLEEDDDDCVILDGDPDKTAAGNDEYKLGDKDGDGDDDEVLVVGQKGEIACRDFPHPRHSCAKYSFNSTSHEIYCDMCHCYVCDIPAPCPYWCVVGVSGVDHCHANDKEKIWKNQREFCRTGIMPTEPSPKPTATPLPTVTQQISPSPAHNLIRLSQIALPNRVEIRPCTSTSRVSNLSSVRNRHRIRQPVPQNHGGLQSVVNGRSSVIRKDRSSYMGNVRSRVATASGTGYGAVNGNNNIKAGPYTNAKVTQPTYHNSPVVPPPAIAPELYPQQQQQQRSRLPEYRAAVTGSQSSAYTQHQDQSKSVGGNGDPFELPELPRTTVVSQAETAEQEPGTNENALQSKLYEFESWLMDSSNQACQLSPLPESVSEDYVSPLTFDFETFLND